MTWTCKHCGNPNLMEDYICRHCGKGIRPRGNWVWKGLLKQNKNNKLLMTF